MYIVPQFLKNEAKKLIKCKISKIITDITDEMIDSIFDCNQNEKYQKMMLEIDKISKDAILKVLKESFTILDNLYASSADRNKFFNISKPNAHRSIITIFGELEFERIYYYDKSNKNKYFYFIDSLFDLPAYDRYDKVVKGMAIANAIDTNQKKGAEITTKQINNVSSSLNKEEQFIISRQDIYLWLDKWEVPEVEYDAIETDSKTLYIMIDEKYIHEQIKMLIDKENKINSPINVEEKTDKEITLEYLKNFINQISNPPLLLPAPKDKTRNFIMSKAFVVFTDIEIDHKRRTLNNKIVFLTAKKNPWDEFMDFIPKIYDFKQFETIKVLSDAGVWITAGISNLKLFVENVIVPCLCEFHAKQKVNRSTKDENMRRLLIQAIKDNDKEEFNRLFNTLLKDKSENRLKTLKSYKHYIVSHWEAIQNMGASTCKSSMESHISHIVAKYFSYEPKAYSGKHIQKLLKLRQHKENGINICALYLKSIGKKEKVIIKKEELSFSMFENNSPSNMPVLYSGWSYTSIALRALVG